MSNCLWYFTLILSPSLTSFPQSLLLADISHRIGYYSIVSYTLLYHLSGSRTVSITFASGYFFIECRSRPVYCCLIPFKHIIPIDLLTFARLMPSFCLWRISKYNVRTYDRTLCIQGFQRQYAMNPCLAYLTLRQSHVLSFVIPLSTISLRPGHRISQSHKFREITYGDSLKSTQGDPTNWISLSEGKKGNLMR